MSRQIGAGDQRSPDERYAESIAIHHRLEALYPRVADGKVFLRSASVAGPNVPMPTGTHALVDTDRIFCGLAIKAATTKRSILALCELGDGQGALVLTRVLFENAFLLEWLIRGPGRDRLETFVAALSIAFDRTRETLEHFSDQFGMDLSHVDRGTHAYHRAVREAFGLDEYPGAFVPKDVPPPQKTSKKRKSKQKSEDDKKAVRRVSIAEMVREVQNSRRPFEYDVIYSILSDEVHSSAMSLTKYLRRLMRSQYFEVQPMPDRDTRAWSLAISNTAMHLVLSTVNEFCGLGIESDLAEITDFIRKYDEPGSQPAATERTNTGVDGSTEKERR